MKVSSLALIASTTMAAVASAADSIRVGAFNDSVFVNTYDTIYADLHVVDPTVKFSNSGQVSIMLPTAKKGRWSSPECVLVERADDISLAKSHKIDPSIIEHADGYTFITAPFKLGSAPLVADMKVACSIKTPAESSMAPTTPEPKSDPYQGIIYAGIFFDNGARGTQTRDQASPLSVVDYRMLFKNGKVEASGDNFNYGDGLRLELKKAQVHFSGPITISDNMYMLDFYSKNDIVDVNCNGEISGSNIKVTAKLNSHMTTTNENNTLANRSVGFRSVTFTLERGVPYDNTLKIFCPDITAMKQIRGIPLAMRVETEVEKDSTPELYLNSIIISLDNSAQSIAILATGAMLVASLFAMVF